MDADEMVHHILKRLQAEKSNYEGFPQKLGDWYASFALAKAIQFVEEENERRIMDTLSQEIQADARKKVACG